MQELVKELKVKLREVNLKLNALLKIGSNDETLVEVKRDIQKQLRELK